MNHLNQHTPDRHRDLFSRATLELTFRMLRQPRPSLALALRNALVEHPPARQGGAYTIEELPLSAERIDAIVEALRGLSNDSHYRAGSSKAEVVLVRSLLLDWIMIARQQSDLPPPLTAVI